MPQGCAKRGQDSCPSEVVTLFIHSLGLYFLRPAIHYIVFLLPTVQQYRRQAKVPALFGPDLVIIAAK